MGARGINHFVNHLTVSGHPGFPEDETTPLTAGSDPGDLITGGQVAASNLPRLLVAVRRAGRTRRLFPVNRGQFDQLPFVFDATTHSGYADGQFVSASDPASLLDNSTPRTAA